jgi:hypothetical protein
MSGKNKSGKKTAEVGPENTAHRRSGPEKLSEESRYEGYDDQRTSLDPAREGAYDVDENHERSDEYKDDGGNSPEQIPGKQ